MTRRRVLIIMEGLPPWHFSGGTPRLYRWCDTLPRLGWDVSVVGYSGRAAKHDPLPSTTLVTTVNNQRLIDRLRRRIGWGSGASVVRLGKAIERAILAATPDIVMPTGLTRDFSVLSAASAAWQGPFVLDTRDNILRRRGYGEGVGDDSALSAMQQAYPLVDGIAGVTQDILDEWREAGFAGPTALVPNSFTRQSSPTPQPAWPGRKAGKFELVYTGMLTGTTTLAVLLPGLQRAIQSSPELANSLRVRVIGLAKPDCIGDWSGGLAGLLSVEPQVPYRKSLEIMRGAAVLLLPRADAGVKEFIPGGKMYEYMGARRPVLAISHGAPAQLTRECQIGLTAPPDDPDAVADAILKLYGMWQKNEPFPFGPESLIDPYEVTHSAKALIGLFEQVLQRAQKN